MDNNYYNPYTNNTEYNNTTQQPKKKSSFAGFGVTLTKVVAIALVFGLVAGTSGLAVMHFAGDALGISVFAEDEEKDKDKKPSVDSKDDTTESETKEDSSEKDKVVANIEQTTTATETSVAVMDVSDIVESVMPCVVAINNTSEVIYQGMWGESYAEESESAGTGFIVEQDEDYIYIATNNHVVDGAKELTVQFSDSAIVNAEVKGTVASKDLAVIKVALADISSETLAVIRVATLGNSNELEVGEGAIAIGNALGYGQSVTTGVISALGRSVTVTDSTTGSYIVNNNLIQTDAAINPGNSGGALLNVKGEVIGINSVKYADTEVEGIGYAIPISDAMLVIDKLIEGEKIDETQSGYLGIQGQDSSFGVYVYKVFEGSAAESAGIRPGDIIVEFEGNTISSMSQLKELLSYYPAGTEVHFVILQAQGNEYAEVEITVVLGDASTLPQQ